MPNNKKKGNRRLASSSSSINAATNAVVTAMPSFPEAETPEQAIERILGYKFVSLNAQDCSSISASPVSFSRRVEDDTIVVQEYSKDMVPQFLELQKYNTFDQDKKFMYPDYNRNIADYPVAKRIMARTALKVDLTRRVKKCIKDVPPDSLEVFLKFMELGENINVGVIAHNDDVTRETSTTTHPDLLQMFQSSDILILRYMVELVEVGSLDDEGKGEENCFMLESRNGVNSMQFFGKLNDNKVLEKYKKELLILLCHEIMVRVSNGNAPYAISNQLGDISKYKLINGVARFLETNYTNSRSWDHLASLHFFRLDEAIKHKCSLHETLEIASGLGETLEGCGFFSKAAQIYEEAAQYAFKSKHPFASKLLSFAGLAWKRYGDREQAEIFYAAALHSMHLVYNHFEYRAGLFNVLTNLWLLWYDPDRDDSPLAHTSTLRALIIGAGERSESLGPDEYFPKPTNGSTFLCPAYHNAPKERIYGAIQYIAVNSVSVEALRDAVIKFANRHNSQISTIGGSAGANRQRDSKMAAREFLLGDRVGPNSADFLASCDACGQMKEEKKLKACPCKNAYYCDTSCQKIHWREEHKDKCTATLKVAKKQSKQKEEGVGM